MRRSLLLVLCLCACAQERLLSVDEDLQLGEPLAFEATWVGFSRELPLRILNRGRGERSFRVTTEAPFSLVDADDTLTLGGGESLELRVQFSPLALGAVHGSVRLEDQSVALEGEGVAPPSCPSDQSCRTFVPDPLLGGCREVVKPDDAACSDACVTAGQCQQGQCMGVFRDCDDHDACTTDTCVASEGCRHLDASSACASSDPCQAPSCDPSKGCTTTPVNDGTRCGPADCALANVCLQGRCQAIVPPDGFECAPASTCQGAGRCVSGRCDRPAATPVAPVWSHSVLSGDQISFEGISDDQGNLYWVECQLYDFFADEVPPSCRAVSFTGAGLSRFETWLAGYNTGSTSQILESGRFVTLTNDGVVSAVDTSDGALVWSGTVLINRESASGLKGSLAADGVDRLWAITSTTIQRSNGEGVLTRFSLQTGAVLGREVIRGALGADVAERLLVIDEQGNVYVRVSPGAVRSWDRDGNLRFQLDPSVAFDTVWATYGGVLELEGQARFWTDGTVHSTRSLSYTGAALLLERDRALRMSFVPPVNAPMVNSLWLERLDGAQPSGALIANMGPEDSRVTVPVALTSGTLVFAGRGTPSHLVGVTLAGEERFDCPVLDQPEVNQLRLSSTMGLTTSHLALFHENTCPQCAVAQISSTISVYALSGLGTRAKGWSSLRGTSGGAGHPTVR